MGFWGFGVGTSIVYVTHDQIEAMTLGTRIVVLNQGLVQQIGTPEEVFDTPANLFVADFMGSPPMNLIPGKLSLACDGAARSQFIRTDFMRDGSAALADRLDRALGLRKFTRDECDNFFLGGHDGAP